MVGTGGSPAKDVGWTGNGARVSSGTETVEPSDQLLVEVSALRQWPAADVFKRQARERKAGVKTAGGIFFLDLACIVTENFRGLWPAEL
jgi:hypothetical protein